MRSWRGLSRLFHLLRCRWHKVPVLTESSRESRTVKHTEGFIPVCAQKTGNGPGDLCSLSGQASPDPLDCHAYPRLVTQGPFSVPCQQVCSICRKICQLPRGTGRERCMILCLNVASLQLSSRLDPGRRLPVSLCTCYVGRLVLQCRIGHTAPHELSEDSGGW